MATTTVQATYWSRPQVVLTDTQPAGSTPNYRIVAVDGDGNTANSQTVSTTVTGTAGSDYAETVMDDGASLYWRLGGTAAQGGNDLVGNNDAVVRSGVTSNSGGALPSEPGPSYNFNGTSSGFLNSTSTAPVGQQYSTELWFKTTTTTGGKLIGYGNSASGTSSNYDRHVYMRNDGRLTFGTHPGIVRTVTSTNAYRDGNWHHMVASQGWDGMKLYVDGQLVGALPDNTSQAYNGYWRVGGDNLGSWPSRPSSDYFAGQIDEVAVYNRVLTSQEVIGALREGHGRRRAHRRVHLHHRRVGGLGERIDLLGASRPDDHLVQLELGRQHCSGQRRHRDASVRSGWHLHDHADGDGQPGTDGVDVEGRHRGPAAREPDGGLQHAGRTACRSASTARRRRRRMVPPSRRTRGTSMTATRRRSQRRPISTTPPARTT